MTDNSVSECLRRFLLKQQTTGNADLVKFWCEHDLETQVLTRCQFHRGQCTNPKACIRKDAEFDWWNIRKPHDAMSQPTWRDYQLTWPLELYATGIGSTGWDWKAERSRYVAFDFDTIIGHATCGIPDADLEKIKQSVRSIPWVQVRRSTGGQGIHLYVWFPHDGPATETHTQHARLAKHVLDKISQSVGFDLAQHADTVGGNFWLWHKKLKG